VCARDEECHSIDVTTAFLYGELDRPVYVITPQGFPGGAGQILRLKRALYGLRQAPRAWYERMSTHLVAFGFKATASDPALFIALINGVRVVLLLYVDDALIASKSLALVEKVKAHIKAEFAIRDLGEVKRFLGYEVHRDRAAGTLVITQRALVRSYVEEFGAMGGRDIPMSPGLVLTKRGPDEEEGPPAYSKLLGCLMYIANGTRPDIAYSCTALARYMSAPSMRHWRALWSVLRYVASTPNLGIRYSRRLAGVFVHSDADFAGDVDTRRSMSGRAAILNGGAVFWAAKQQVTVAFSTVEAESAAGVMALKESVWLRGLLIELGWKPFTLDLCFDNTGCIRNVLADDVRPRMKHVAVNMAGLRDYVRQGILRPVYVSTNDMAADVLTKALPLSLHARCRMLLGMAEHADG
jgi:hypothetical protein